MYILVLVRHKKPKKNIHVYTCISVYIHATQGCGTQYNPVPKLVQQVWPDGMTVQPTTTVQPFHVTSLFSNYFLEAEHFACQNTQLLALPGPYT